MNALHSGGGPSRCSRYPYDRSKIAICPEISRLNEDDGLIADAMWPGAPRRDTTSGICVPALVTIYDLRLQHRAPYQFPATYIDMYT